MKFKGLTKIALAGAAVAVTAATLATSTYAWYVSNAEATATGVTSSTVDASGSSVYVSKDGTKFKGAVTFADTDFAAENAMGNVRGQLNPVTTDNGTQYIKDEAATTVTAKLADTDTAFYPVPYPVDAELGSYYEIATGTATLTTDSAVSSAKTYYTTTKQYTADTTHYLKVSVWVKSDNDCKVTPLLQVANTTEAIKKQTAYTDVTGSLTAGSEFFVDAVNALRVCAVVTPEATTYAAVASPDVAKIATYYEKGTDGTYSKTSDSALGASKTYYLPVEETSTIYDVSAIAKASTDKTSAYTAVNGSLDETDLTTGYGAHSYYQAIMGVAPEHTSVSYTNTTSAMANITLNANVATKITYYFWLEGADISCYDSCAGQTFSFGFNYSLAA